MICDSFPVALEDLPDFTELPGGDLIWWREGGEWHTLVSVDCSIESNNHIDPGSLGRQRLLLVWFDRNGTALDAQQITVLDRSHLVLDSRNLQALFGRSIATGSDGVLSVILWPEATTDPRALLKYSRLYATVDWHSSSGHLISLHSDQSFKKTAKAIDFTEIVVWEAVESENSLVIVNGLKRQSAGALRPTITNALGETLTTQYTPEMAPFSLHRLHLATLFPGIGEFARGMHLTVGGHFACDSLYTRPYVITEGVRTGGYHGGDRYKFNPIPRIAHRLLGRGETNPMVVIENGELSTSVNLLNSHCGVEGDYWVDAHVYDREGRLIAERERWLLARRHGLSRGHVRELLPDPESEFVGHICLSFAESDAAVYPMRLQALLEYRGHSSVARVMAWSDLWNARERIASILGSIDPRMNIFSWGPKDVPDPGRLYSSHYRAWCGDEMETWLAITNAGTLSDYNTTIDYIVELTGHEGETLTCSRSLAPFATSFCPISEIFPRARDVLRTGGVGMLRVTSQADLASVQFTKHLLSGAWGAEHLMADASLFNGTYRSASGS